MESQDPLSELADIHLPEAVSAWPPAYGWWILLLLVICACVFAKQRYFTFLIKRRRLGSAMNKLEQIYQQFQLSPQQNRNQAGLSFLQDVNSTLRRVALSVYPHAAFISKLSGKAWLDFLDASGNTVEFNSGPGQALADGVYQRHFDTDAEALYILAKHWIEQRYNDSSSAQHTLPTNPKSELLEDIIAPAAITSSASAHGEHKL